jgi:hypothetical protein
MRASIELYQSLGTLEILSSLAEILIHYIWDNSESANMLVTWAQPWPLRRCP